ncbi:MAG: inorganic diphosphatase [Weeksellaceae bacterium]|jgi:inorganic pyrophosphatase|nr:inorganic diphosphatase [Weeksellaceae bacterium]
MKFNPWHHVSVGKEQPDVVQAIIEIPQGSKAKYELDKASGMLRLDRVLFSSLNYPHNYGFIPQTLGEDNDPLDIIVISQIDVDPMCIVDAKVIGVLRMIDNGEGDDKIIAVAQNDMSVNHINEVSELPPHLTVELQNFFEDYKKLENKIVVVEDFQNAEIAKKIVTKSIEDYKDYAINIKKKSKND